MTRSIQSLSGNARADAEKRCPVCLRKLYQTTLAEIRDHASLLVEQTHDRLLEKEQLTIDWK